MAEIQLVVLVRASLWSGSNQIAEGRPQTKRGTAMRFCAQYLSATKATKWLLAITLLLVIKLKEADPSLNQGCFTLADLFT